MPAETRDILDDLDDGYGGFDFNEALLKRAAAEIRRLREQMSEANDGIDWRDRKQSHGCTDAHCDECDGPRPD